MSEYQYYATVSRVVDGDTLDLILDLGFKVSVAQRVRLYGIDTPETYGVKKGSDEYVAGKAAKDYVEKWLTDCNAQPAAQVPAAITIQSYDGNKLHTGKFGRWIADIYRPGDTTSLSAALVDAGHAKYVSY